MMRAILEAFWDTADAWKGAQRNEGCDHRRCGWRRQRRGPAAPARRTGGNCGARAHGLCLICQLRPAILCGRRHSPEGGSHPADTPELSGAFSGGGAGTPRGDQNRSGQPDGDGPAAGRRQRLRGTL